MATATAPSEVRLQTLMAMLDLHTTHYGPFHPDTVAAANQLAIVLWHRGEVQQAIGILDQALTGLAQSEHSDHSVRTDVLCTLGEIFVEHSLWPQASEVYREIVDCCTRRCGSYHPSALAAKGDLAIALFELGRHEEAAEIERQVAQDARDHLGQRHPVSCVLAWNRALRHHHDGNAHAARTILIDELAWLLTAGDHALDPDQKAIRELVAGQVQWERASVC